MALLFRIRYSLFMPPAFGFSKLENLFLSSFLFSLSSSLVLQRSLNGQCVIIPLLGKWCEEWVNALMERAEVMEKREVMEVAEVVCRLCRKEVATCKVIQNCG